MRAPRGQCSCVVHFAVSSTLLRTLAPTVFSLALIFALKYSLLSSKMRKNPIKNQLDKSFITRALILFIFCRHHNSYFKLYNTMTINISHPYSYSSAQMNDKKKEESRRWQMLHQRNYSFLICPKRKKKRRSTSEILVPTPVFFFFFFRAFIYSFHFGIRYSLLSLFLLIESKAKRRRACAVPAQHHRPEMPLCRVRS